MSWESLIGPAVNLALKLVGREQVVVLTVERGYRAPPPVMFVDAPRQRRMPPAIRVTIRNRSAHQLTVEEAVVVIEGGARIQAEYFSGEKIPPFDAGEVVFYHTDVDPDRVRIVEILDRAGRKWTKRVDLRGKQDVTTDEWF